MNSSLEIRNVKIVRPGESIAAGAVLVCDGKIEALDQPAPAGAQCVDGEGGFLTPGLIDIHTHGIGKSQYERAPEDITEGAALLPRFGTTCILPTLYRVLNRESLEHLSRLASAMEKVSTVRMPGFHLEGPFLALPGAGAFCMDGDVPFLEELLAACHGRVSAMAVSPDTPGILPVIGRLCEKGIVPLITHTQASVKQTIRAIDAGAVHATHFYDVFPVPPEVDAGVRPCGAVEAILADPECSVDFIADGAHVDPVAIRCALAAKGFSKILLITDSNVGAGLPEGVYDTPWGYPVRVKAGAGARVADPAHSGYGTLAGSAVTMDEGIRNLHRWLDLPLEQIWAMGTSNVATLLGLASCGRIEPGAHADLVLWNADLTVRKTWVNGRLVYDHDNYP